jgi:hypothetical protein
LADASFAAGNPAGDRTRAPPDRRTAADRAAGFLAGPAAISDAGRASRCADADAFSSAAADSDDADASDADADALPAAADAATWLSAADTLDADYWGSATFRATYADEIEPLSAV